VDIGLYLFKNIYILIILQTVILNPMSVNYTYVATEIREMQTTTRMKVLVTTTKNAEYKCRQFVKLPFNLLSVHSSQ
jgi:D-ribose pyranose/furanose isomerase RbsD